MAPDFYRKAIKEKNRKNLYYEASEGPDLSRAEITNESDYHIQGAMELMEQKGLSPREAVDEFLDQIGYRSDDFYKSSLAIEIEKSKGE